jgi:molecular chaperone HtpG
MDKMENLMPPYLCFIRGVVDSEDLPLNISRESLQQNKIITVMRKHIVKKSLDLIGEIAEDPEKYKSFYECFSKNIKLGIHEDFGNKDKLSKLLRYPSANSGKDLISFDQYIEKMPESQKVIYYITGESVASIESSPFLEKLRSRNMDVLYMVDPIDEYCMQQLRNYEGKDFYCITKENFVIDQSEDEKESFHSKLEGLKDLCKYIKELLPQHIEKVVVSQRLVLSPCTLVTGQFGWTANMERLVKAQALQNNATQMQSQMMATRKTLEINPDHPVIIKLRDLHKSEDKTNLDANITLLFETSLLSSGFTLTTPVTYTSKINHLMALGLGVSDKELRDWNSERQEETYKNSNEDTESKTQEETDSPTEGEGDESMEEVD